MKYISTRGDGRQLTAAEAIIAGMAADGGLFVPRGLPRVNDEFLMSLLDLSYEKRAVKVLELFLTDYTEDELRSCVRRAYRETFDTPKVAPVESVGDYNVLELWHGPTSAFKDMALQLLPQLMSAALRKTGEKSEIVILVATSGDTGKAALEGFKDAAGIKIVVFFPKDGVSPIQRLQMVTQEGTNVAVAAVNGNFDDAQSGVKRIFADERVRSQMSSAGFKLSSANSINWGRLVPQIVYYFSAYADMVANGRLNLGDKINFVVPTGNFGNILAGYYAKQMGLPVHKFICASNSNNVLTDFLRTGVYDRNRHFYKTISPSMDILISSNLERLLYHVSGDEAMTADWMKRLEADGRYEIDAASLAAVREQFWADWCDDETALAKIKTVYERYSYVVDPHTAVAWQALDNYRAVTGDITGAVIVSTASPYKFNDSVLAALDGKRPTGEEFALLERLAEFNQNPIPRRLAMLKTAAIRHDAACDKERMADLLLSLLEANK